MRGGRPSKRFLVAAMTVCFVAWCNCCQAAELSLPIQTSVKSVAPAKPPAQPVAMNVPVRRPEPPTPTLPSGKLPQYQFGHDNLVDLSEADLGSDKRRLLIALPGQLVLLEAHMTIDGKPFAMAREERIRTLLKTADKGVEKREVKLEVPVVMPNQVQNGDDEETSEDAEDKEEVELVQPTVPAYERVSGSDDFVRRYYATTGAKPSAEEIRWLITHRVDGPVLLMLGENFQRFRATERPAFNVLDRDLDGTVSKDEVEKAVDSFERCDENQNDIVDYKELETVANRVRKSSKGVGVGKLVSQIPTKATAASVYRRLMSHYKEQPTALARFDKNTNGKFDPDEIKAFVSVEPDVQVDVSFDTTDSSKSKIAITKIGKSFVDHVSDPRSLAGSISLRFGRPSEPSSVGTIIALSAIQKQASDQIAIGAVSDGYPILPMLDPNQDGKFTIRERRQLLDRVKKFDTNQDGSITADEAQSTIRVCFALGPYAHQELASLRVTHTSAVEAVVGPEWFRRMDRNKDNDISVREFLGDEEQFAALDTDRDELVSAAEANAFEKKNETPEAKPEPKSEPKPEVDSVSNPEPKSEAKTTDQDSPESSSNEQ